MDHFLIGQLLSASFLGPAGLTSVCFPSRSPVSYHISTDGFEVSLSPPKYRLIYAAEEVYRVIMHGKGSLQVISKSFPEDSGTIPPIFEICLNQCCLCMPLGFPHVLSLFSLSLYLPLCVSLILLKAIVALKPSETLWCRVPPCSMWFVSFCPSPPPSFSQSD